MAFSRSEELDVQPVSVSYSSATSRSPLSATSHLSPKQEDAVVDADAIERWLTYPTKPDSTNAERPNTQRPSSERYVDDTFRRRQQLLQSQQSSLSKSFKQEREDESERAATISPRADLRRSKLMRQRQNNKEQIQSPPFLTLGSNIVRDEDSGDQRTTSTADDDENGTGGRKLSHDSDRLSHYRRYKRGDDAPNEDYFPSKVVNGSSRSTSNLSKDGDSSNGLTMMAQLATTTTTTTPSGSQVTESRSNRFIASSNAREALGMRVAKTGATSLGVTAIRRRRQLRLQRRQFEKELTELEKDHQKEEPTKAVKTTSSVGDNSKIMEGKELKIIKRTPNNQSDMITNAIPISPVASRYQINKTSHHQGFIGNKYEDNSDANELSNVTHQRKMITQNPRSVDLNGDPMNISTSTKKIHFLKRHDGDMSESPLSTSIGLSAIKPKSVDINGSNDIQYTDQFAIHSHESPKSTIGRLQMIRRQATNRNKSSNHEQLAQHVHEQMHEQRSAVGKHNSSRLHREDLEENFSSQNRHQLREHHLLESVQLQGQTNRPRGLNYYNDQPITFQNDHDQHINKNASYNTPSNVRNSRRIKAALVHTRSHRHTISELSTDRNEFDNDPRTNSDESYGDVSREKHIQSRGMPHSRSTAADTSLISVVSVDSSVQSNESHANFIFDSDHEDSDASIISSVSRTTGHGNETEREVGSKISYSSADKYDASVSLESDKSSGSSDGESTEGTLVKATSDSSFIITRKWSERQQQQLQARRLSSQIKLHVYDLVADDAKLDLWGCHFPLGQVFNAFNSSLHSIGTGAYHVGLEINGIEYAYGANSTKDLTGIFTCIPKCSPGYQFRTTIDFGNRVVMKKSVKGSNEIEEAVNGREIIRLMATDYIGTDYDLLRKNCCTFVHDACIRLGIDEKEIPSWFHNLAAVGAVTQDAANYTLSPITQLFSGTDLDSFTNYLNETPLTDRLEAIQDLPSQVKRDHEYVADTAYQF